MPTISTVIAALDAFEPSEDELDTTMRLDDLLKGLEELPGREQAIIPMLHLLERFPDTEFGTPGPIVHTLESIPGYEKQLAGSLLRQPTDLTVWMVNRILNSDLTRPTRTAWLRSLRQVRHNVNALPSVRQRARVYLRYQCTGALE